MKTILLKGVEIKIGSRVRFVNDKGLYTEVDGVIKPEVGKVYTVRDINDLGGFLLEEVKNVSSIIDKLLANNHIPPAHIPSKNLNAENFFGMLAGKIDENILNKFNKKSTYDLKNDIYFSIIKKASIDRIFYGNYADIDDIELIVIIILSEALLAKKSYEEILKKEGDKDFLENKLKDLYLKKIEMLEKL